MLVTMVLVKRGRDTPLLSKIRSDCIDSADSAGAIVIVQVNLLIASMNTTYEKVMQKSTQMFWCAAY